jgi:hypothetical protein
MTNDKLYPKVAKTAHTILTGMEVDCSTTELGNHICQVLNMREPDERRQVFYALAWYATHELAMCATRGAPFANSFGKIIRPWRWHRPTKPNTEQVKYLSRYVAIPPL